MTISSWPYVDQDVTDIEYGRLYSEIAATDGVVDTDGTYGGTPLQAYADSSGMQIKVRAGAALLRGYMFYSTAEEVVPIVAADAGARVDLLVLELNLSEPTIANRIRFKVLKGTSGSSTAPSLTQTDTGIYQIALATIAVGAGATTIAAANVVTTVRKWTENKVGFWETANRPTGARLRPFKLGYNVTKAGWEFWDGTGWKDLGAVSLTSSLVTGVLPIVKGGTGADDAIQALQNLGIYVQSTKPAYAAGRVWIKIPA